MFKKSASIIIDFLFISVLVFVTSTIYIRLLMGNFLGQDYMDWMNMAYRTKLINDYGITNWTHITGNGQNVWQAFQFIPQYIASLYSKLANTSISTSLLHVTFIFINLSTVAKYFALRLLKSSKLIALVTSLITLSIPQTVVTMWDYSIFIGLAFLPIFLYFLVKNEKNYRVSVLPFLIGIGFYIHPLLSFNVLIFYIILAALNNQLKNLYFYLNLIIVTAVSGYYWINAFFYTGVYYLDESQTNVLFVRSLLSFSLSGLSQSVLLFLALAFLFYILFFNNKFKYNKLYLAVFIYGISLSLWILITYNYDIIPAFLNKFQVTRWVPFIATTAIIYSGLIFGDILKNTVNKLIIYFLLFVLFGFFFIENYDPSYQTSIMRYAPHTIKSYEEPFNTYVLKHNVKPSTYKSTIFTLRAPETAYLNFKDYFTDGLYFHFSPNPISRVLIKNVIDFTGGRDEYHTILNYFDTRSIDYIVLSDQVNFSKYAYNLYKMNENEKLKLVYEFKQSDGEKYYVFENTKSLPKAFYINKTDSLNKFDTSSLYYPYDTSYINRYNNDFAKYLKNNYEDNLNLNIDFSNPEEIVIKNVDANKKIGIISNFDTNWYSDKADVKLFGPSYILVDNIKSGGDLVLKYKTPLSSLVGIYVSLGGIGIWLLLYLLSTALNFKKPKSLTKNFANNVNSLSNLEG